MGGGCYETMEPRCGTTRPFQRGKALERQTNFLRNSGVQNMSVDSWESSELNCKVEDFFATLPGGTWKHTDFSGSPSIDSRRGVFLHFSCVFVHVVGLWGLRWRRSPIVEIFAIGMVFNLYEVSHTTYVERSTQAHTGQSVRTISTLYKSL